MLKRSALAVENEQMRSEVSARSSQVLKRSKTARYGPVLLFILGVDLWLFRNYFTESFPAGSDTLGWIARIAYVSVYLRGYYVWYPQCFGSVDQYWFLTPMALLNYLLQNSVLTFKLVCALSLLLSGLSMYFFAYRYSRDGAASAAASFVYMTNQYVIGMIAGGQVDFVMGYALAPLIIVMIDNALDSENTRDSVLLSMLVSFLAFLVRPDLALMYAPFIVLYLVLKILMPPPGMTCARMTRVVAKMLCTSLLFGFFLGAFFIVPMLSGVVPLYATSSFVRPLYFHQKYSLELLRTTIGLARDIGYLNYVGNTWYSSPFLEAGLYYMLMAVVPVIALAGALVRRDKMSAYLSLAAVLSVFVAKGPNEPLSSLFFFAYANVPLFNLFRVPNRWLGITFLAYSVLFGIGIKSVFSATKGCFSTLSRCRPRLPRIRSWGVILFLVFFALVSSPFTAIYGFQVWNPPEEEVAPHRWISEQPGDFRILTIPFDETYMWAGWHTELDLGHQSYQWHGKPVVRPRSGWNEYADQFTMFARNCIKSRCTNSLAEILGAENVRYIVFQGYGNSSYERAFFVNQLGLEKRYDQRRIVQYSIFSPIVVADDYQAAFWHNLNQSAVRISDCTAEGKTLTGNTLRVDVRQSEPGLHALISKEFSDPQNWRGKKFLILLFAGTGSGVSLELRVVDSSSRAADFSFVDASDQMTAVVLSVDNAGPSGESTDWSSISAVELRAEGSGEGVYYLDMLALAEDVKVKTIREWVELPEDSRSSSDQYLPSKVVFGPGEISLSLTESAVSVWENGWNGEFFVPSGVSLVVGGREALYAVLSVPGLRYDELGALFSDQIASLGGHDELFKVLGQSNKTIFVNSDPMDLTMLGLPLGTRALHTKSGLESVTDSRLDTGTNQLNREVLQLSKGQSVSFDYRTGKADTYEVWMRPFFTDSVGSISVFVNGDKVGDILPWAPYPSGFKWVRIGRVSLNQVDNHVTIENNGTVKASNLIDDLVIIPSQSLASEMEIFEGLLKKQGNLYMLLEGEQIFKYVAKPPSACWAVIRDGFSASGGYALEAMVPEHQGAALRLAYGVPMSGEYRISLRARPVDDQATLSLTVDGKFLGTVSLTNHSGESGYRWLDFESVRLSVGEHMFDLESTGKTKLDQILVHMGPLASLGEQKSRMTIVSHERIDPATYRIVVDVTSPGLLVFSQAYDPMWRLSVGREEVTPIISYSFVNGYLLSKTGLQTFTLRFRGQDTADCTIVLSGVSWAAAIVCIFVGYATGGKVGTLFTRRNRLRLSLGPRNS